MYDLTLSEKREKEPSLHILTSGIHERHDLQFWQYIRTSIWYKKQSRAAQSLSSQVRCLEKISKDFAFLNVVLAKQIAKESRMKIIYNLTQKLSIIGKLVVYAYHGN